MSVPRSPPISITIELWKPLESVDLSNATLDPQQSITTKKVSYHKLSSIILPGASMSAVSITCFRYLWRSADEQKCPFELKKNTLCFIST